MIISNQTNWAFWLCKTKDQWILADIELKPLKRAKPLLIAGPANIILELRLSNFQIASRPYILAIFVPKQTWYPIANATFLLGFRAISIPTLFRNCCHYFRKYNNRLKLLLAFNSARYIPSAFVRRDKNVYVGIYII